MLNSGHSRHFFALRVEEQELKRAAASSNKTSKMLNLFFTLFIFKRNR